MVYVGIKYQPKDSLLDIVEQVVLKTIELQESVDTEFYSQLSLQDIVVFILFACIPFAGAFVISEIR